MSRATIVSLAIVALLVGTRTARADGDPLARVRTAIDEISRGRGV